eukprot:gene826-464_t
MEITPTTSTMSFVCQSVRWINETTPFFALQYLLCSASLSFCSIFASLSPLFLSLFLSFFLLLYGCALTRSTYNPSLTGCLAEGLQEKIANTPSPLSLLKKLCFLRLGSTRGRRKESSSFDSLPHTKQQ